MDLINLIQGEHLLKQYYNRYGGFWVYPEILDYCYLVNPYFSHSKIIDEMNEKFRQLISEYPSGISVNSTLASKCWGINPEYIIPGNGAAELIKVFMEQIKGKVGVVRPTFEEYPNRLFDDQVITFIPQNGDFRYGVDDLIEYFTENPVETILLINPDNPSGNFIQLGDVHRLAQWCEDNAIHMVLDESFVDFTVNFRGNSFLSNDVLEKYPHICVIKSISKSYGVPGLRLGIFCSANKLLISNVKKRLSIWNINSFAQFFMQILPKYRKEYNSACERLIHERERFEIELKKIPFLRVMPSQANYFFVEVLPPHSAIDLSIALIKEHNILVSACLEKKGIESNKYIRIAVRNEIDNARFVKALKEYIR